MSEERKEKQDLKNLRTDSVGLASNKKSDGKGNIFDKFVEWKRGRLINDLNDLNLSSPSNIFVRHVINNLFDYIMWGIIIYIAVVIWWPAVGAPVTCERITMDFCESCFASFMGLG